MVELLGVMVVVATEVLVVVPVLLTVVTEVVVEVELEVEYVRVVDDVVVWVDAALTARVVTAESP